MRWAKKLSLIFLLILIFLSLGKNLLNYQEKLKFYEAYKQEYEKEFKKNLELKTQYLKKTDQYEVEKTIRNKLNLMKENEVSIILPPLTPSPIILTPTPIPNWQQWQRLFFRIDS
jgi:hypothetical protein